MMLLLLVTLAIIVLLTGAALWREHRRARTFRRLLDLSPNGLLILDRRQRVRWHNPAAARLLDPAEKTDPTGQPITRWLPMLDTLPAPMQRMETLLRRGDQQTQQDLTRLPDIGRQRILLLHPTAEQQAGSEAMERFKRSQYFARIGTWDWDIGTDRLYWSEAIYGMFGYQPGEVTPSYSLFCDSVHPEDRERVKAGEQRCIDTGENHDEEYRVIWPDGSVHWVRETGNVVKNEHGQPVKMMGVVRDITEEKRSVRELEQRAHQDPLTGLPNRLMLEQRLFEALTRARARQTRLALVFIDLNQFKAINDQLGHASGDEVLLAVAQRLRSAVRSSDMVARLGGDEFVVLLEGLSRSSRVTDEAHQISEKLFASLAPVITLQGRDYRIGASLGVALFPDHAATLDKLIHAADLAMYSAKRSGNNQHRLGEDLNTHAHTLTP